VDSRCSWVVVQKVISGTGNSLLSGLAREIRNVRLAALNLRNLRGGSWVISGQNGDQRISGFT